MYRDAAAVEASCAAVQLCLAVGVIQQRERKANPMNCSEFAKKIIEGSGGMNDFEEHEYPAWNHSERVEAAIWAMKCLANPKCEGSEEALAAIIKHREERQNP